MAPVRKSLDLKRRLASFPRDWKRFNKFNPVLFGIRRALLAARIRHVQGPRRIDYDMNELVVACIFRNGYLHINSFLTHYRSLGVKHFVFIDNGSTDGSPSLLSECSDITLLRTSAPYAVYENVMKTFLVEKFCRGRWCLFADIDELFDYPLSKWCSLAEFLSYLNRHDYTAVITQLLDMFADTPLCEVRSKPDDSLREKYIYYDLSAIRKRRYLSPVPDPRIMGHFGGIRKHAFGTLNGLTKISLFLLDGNLVPFFLWHHTRNSRIADVTTVLLHFPFVETFTEKVHEAAGSGRYGPVTEDEYMAYQCGLLATPRLTLKRKTARALAEVDELVESGFLFASDRYTNWCKGACAVAHEGGR